MRRNKKLIEDRINQIENARSSKELFEKVQIEKHKTSLIAKLDKPVRIVFYCQVFLSLLAFLFFPFKSAEIIKSYVRERLSFKGTNYYVGHIKTNSGKDILVNSLRLHEAKMKAGDPILVEKNFMLKTEGVTNIKENATYFTNAKWGWCFIWFFTLIASIASEFFKNINDLRIKGRFTIGLIVLILLYFIF